MNSVYRRSAVGSPWIALGSESTLSMSGKAVDFNTFSILTQIVLRSTAPDWHLNGERAARQHKDHYRCWPCRLISVHGN